MGPPFEKGGNKTLNGYQWVNFTVLQWGRPSRRAEMKAARKPVRKAATASMGPPFEKGGNRR